MRSPQFFHVDLLKQIDDSACVVYGDLAFGLWGTIRALSVDHASKAGRRLTRRRNQSPRTALEGSSERRSKATIEDAFELAWSCRVDGLAVFAKLFRDRLLHG